MMEIIFGIIFVFLIVSILMNVAGDGEPYEEAKELFDEFSIQKDKQEITDAIKKAHIRPWFVPFSYIGVAISYTIIYFMIGLTSGYLFVNIFNIPLKIIVWTLKQFKFIFVKGKQ